MDVRRNSNPPVVCLIDGMEQGRAGHLGSDWGEPGSRK